jgi:uncharacterized protein YqfA (UPF0365 family)
MGVLDYQRLRNIQADTSMRDAIAGSEERPGRQGGGGLGGDR